MRKNRLVVWAVVMVLLIASSSLSLAQDAEATPEADTDSTTLSETSTLGAFSVDHPEGWFAFPGQDGGYIISNVNLMESAGQFPEGTLLIQVNIAATSALPDTGDDPSARDLLESITPPDQAEELVIEDMELESGAALARVDVSTAESDAVAYMTLLTDQTFAFVVGAAITPGTYADSEDLVLQIIDTISLDLSGEFSDESLVRYDDIEQGTTEEGFPRLGDADAPVSIVEISSFDCPACRGFHDEALPIILERVRAGEASFVYVPIFGTGSIPGGAIAAIAAMCAGEQDAFWTFHDGLFDWQEFGGVAYAEERLIAGATTLELDIDLFEECLSTQDELPAMLQAAQEYAFATEGFTGTPTLLVNGTLVNWDPSMLDSVIDEALESGDSSADDSADDDADSADDSADDDSDSDDSDD